MTTAYAPHFQIDEFVRYKHNGEYAWGRIIEITMRPDETKYIVHDSNIADGDGNTLVTETNLIASEPYPIH